jgi:hypothetical protein
MRLRPIYTPGIWLGRLHTEDRREEFSGTASDRATPPRPFLGTFETCRPALKMSVHRGRSEVIGGRSERRDRHFSDIVVWANDRFAPEAVVPVKPVFDSCRE